MLWWESNKAWQSDAGESFRSFERVVDRELFEAGCSGVESRRMESKMTKVRSDVGLERDGLRSRSFLSGEQLKVPGRDESEDKLGSGEQSDLCLT